MANKLAAIVGIDTIDNERVYRAILAEYDVNKETNEYKWQFKPKMLTEDNIIKSYNKKLNWINIDIVKGKVHGSAGDLKRFEPSNGARPFVILAQTVNSTGKIIGYIIANYEGKVTRVPVKHLIAYGNKATKQGNVPIQNAIFIKQEEERSAHFKSYPNCPFIEETIVVNKNIHSDTRRVQTASNQKTLNKLEQIYTPEQIKQLKLGKQHGVDIRVYANPKLSAEQMKSLRKGLEMKVNVKPFAFPDYEPDIMMFYVTELACKADIRSYLSPKYNRGQIAELSLAAEEGLDISKMSDPSLSATKMGEIRERLRAGVFREMEVGGKMKMVL